MPCCGKKGDGFFCLWLYWSYDWSLFTYMLDHIKTLLMYRAPVKWSPILGHGHEWAGVCRDVGEKHPDVIDESNEALDIIVVPGCSLLSNMSYLACIDMDSFLVDYVPEAVYSVCI